MSTVGARGSEWRRWDPHIHTPGTVLNNQYQDATWDDYLERIEKAKPTVQALGITDYCSLDRYEDVVSHKAAGRLPDVGLVFANVELRIPLQAKSSAINIHLLISPDDPKHIERARHFLRSLKFSYGGEPYSCDNADLIRLGYAYKPDLSNDVVALREGTNQFKVSPESLRSAFSGSEWARENILVAVAAGAGDGSSGLRSPDDALNATRTEIETMAHAMFSGRPGDRTFWIGAGALTTEQLDARYRGRKPCIHGSDAHDLAKVASPDGDRYTWIKGDATFESLRQACIEPEERAFIGEQPPSGPLDYRTISSLDVEGATWLASPRVDLNPGLTAIIGARGSGKTALADLIAAAAGAATPDRTSPQSFLKRAERHISGASSRLTWGDGETSTVALPPAEDDSAQPLVQYLSQQFVDQLCSAEGMTDELVAEVERVVFDAHPPEDRLGAESFQDLLAIKAEPGRLKRQRATDDIAALARQLDDERDALEGLPTLQTQRKKLDDELQADVRARSGLIVRADRSRSTRLTAINTALEAAQRRADVLNRKLASLARLAESVKDLRDRTFPRLVDELHRGHFEAGLSPTDWKLLEIQFVGDPDPRLSELNRAVTRELMAVVGPTINKPSTRIDEIAPFVPEQTDLTSASLNSLQAERWRLSELIGLDKAKTRQLDDLNKKITALQNSLGKIDDRISRSTTAAVRIKALNEQRKKSYAQIFDGFDEEQQNLTDLYSPLAKLLEGDDATLGKLTFTERRVVDVEAWAARGEALLDLRRSGDFRGRDELLRITRATLKAAWETGDSSAVSNAMSEFRANYDAELIKQAPISREADAKAYRRWATQISAWLNSTDHIRLRYGIQYDGVNIEQLSPGTRGIVLLLLYLSLDRTDDRPLLIDQPEENLDPKSIFDELVWRFRAARSRRQIIIVTHNANLVVNTDADQVIVASSGAHRPNRLPELRYLTGGLEDPIIRKQVCDILEGGEQAFTERARRLRLRLK